MLCEVTNSLNSPNSPSSKRKIKTPRLHSLSLAPVPSPTGIRPPPLVLRHRNELGASIRRLSFRRLTPTLHHRFPSMSSTAPGKRPGTLDFPSHVNGLSVQKAVLDPVLPPPWGSDTPSQSRHWFSAWPGAGLDGPWICFLQPHKC